jgi:formylmethanofuran dehydrogenase subunit E
MFVSDDPIRDFHRWDAHQQEQLNKLPKCDDCGEPIQDDYYSIDNRNICSECIDNYKMNIDYDWE